LGLNRNAPFPLDVHAVEVLILFVARVEVATQL
jgi:hypothetical protein